MLKIRLVGPSEVEVYVVRYSKRFHESKKAINACVRCIYTWVCAAIEKYSTPGRCDEVMLPLNTGDYFPTTAHPEVSLHHNNFLTVTIFNI